MGSGLTGKGAYKILSDKIIHSKPKPLF